MQKKVHQASKGDGAGHDVDVPVYVASDSETFKQTMKGDDNFNGGAVRYAEDLCIFQTDRSNAAADGARECNIDSYADLILLARSTCLVASHSSYSYLAGTISQPLGDERQSWRCAHFFDECSSNAHIYSYG